MFSADNFYSQSGSRYVIDKVEHSNEIIIDPKYSDWVWVGELFLPGDESQFWEADHNRARQGTGHTLLSAHCS